SAVPCTVCVSCASQSAARFAIRLAPETGARSSYRTTLSANGALRRSLADESRTMAYLHVDLLTLYLTAPDLRAFIDHVLEVRGVE
ncbi:hypothetical protein, partial [Deinococcus enclensis]|uniref:hypothetical protein n=1 Tax=Deinococcus enclensis TaxID=1049582 RepID=UPI0027D82C27